MHVEAEDVLPDDNSFQSGMEDIDDDDDELSNCVANVDTGMEGMHGVVNEVAINTVSIGVVGLTEAEDGVLPVDKSFQTFMEDVDESNDEPSNCVANVDTGMEGMHGVVNEVATNTASLLATTNTALSFRDEYAKSITPVMAKVDSLFARSMWSGVPIATHPPTFDDDQDKLLAILRKISPSIGDQLQIDSSNIKKHPEIQKVLDNHSRGSAYFRQFFKRPLVAECDCFACREGMFSPIIMPVEAYTELHEKYAMPLPIPKPSNIAGKSDLHYMSFEEAVAQPFTDKHQPSLQKRRRNNNSVGEVTIGARESRSIESDQNKITQGRYIRGVVSCKDCTKPRL